MLKNIAFAEVMFLLDCSVDGDEEMEVDEDVEASGGRRQSKQGKPKPVRLNHKLSLESDNLDGADELQCHFNQNSYRMVYVINRDNYLYREQALPKARQVKSFQAIIIINHQIAS